MNQVSNNRYKCSFFSVNGSRLPERSAQDSRSAQEQLNSVKQQLACAKEQLACVQRELNSVRQNNGRRLKADPGLIDLLLPMAFAVAAYSVTVLSRPSKNHLR